MALPETKALGRLLRRLLPATGARRVATRRRGNRQTRQHIAAILGIAEIAAALAVQQLQRALKPLR